MKVLRGLHKLSDQPGAEIAATIGNFDGIHQGHQALLTQLIQSASQYGLQTMVITFEPLPVEYFGKYRQPIRIMRLREKLAVLRDLGIDTVLCINFNHQFAQMTAEQFIEQILIKKINTKYLLIGDDFRFGYQRLGDFQLLQQASLKYQFKLAQMPMFTLDGIRVSSSRIREMLVKGEFDLATEMLGRPYILSGRVVHGDQLGRQLGFPTANILLQPRWTMLHGVYAVKVHGVSPNPLPGAANVGTRPTVDGKQWLLEVTILDFNQALYGKKIAVEFLCKLRNEEKFDTIASMQQQIKRDVEEVRQFFRFYPC